MQKYKIELAVFPTSPPDGSPCTWEYKDSYPSLEAAEKAAYTIAGADCDVEGSSEFNLRRCFFGAKEQDWWDCRIVPMEN